jgi:hypothetical protein
MSFFRFETACTLRLRLVAVTRAMKRSDTDDFWIKIESFQWVLFVIFAIKNGMPLLLLQKNFIGRIKVFHLFHYKRQVILQPFNSKTASLLVNVIPSLSSKSPFILLISLIAISWLGPVTIHI